MATQQRADTFTEFMETVQWHERDVSPQPNDATNINNEVTVGQGPFTIRELRKAIRKIKGGRAVKEGDIPIECFKALAQEPDEVLAPILEIFNDCLSSQNLPTEWGT